MLVMRIMVVVPQNHSISDGLQIGSSFLFTKVPKQKVEYQQRASLKAIVVLVSSDQLSKSKGALFQKTYWADGEGSWDLRNT